MIYKKYVLYRDFRDNFPSDVPSSYMDVIPYDSKVYITGFNLPQMLGFMRLEEDFFSQKRKYDIAFSVSDVISGLIRREFFDFSFIMDNRRMLSILPPFKIYEKKELIDSYEDAQEKGCLKTYFGDKDWLKISKDTFDGVKKYVFIYNDDYENFLCNFTTLQLAEFYMRWMRENNATLTIKDQDYSNPLNFVDYFFRQLGQYIDIIRNDRKRRYYIIGDGPGTASIACLILSVSYVSMEPNMIGAQARALGIITSIEKPFLEDDDIVFFANVGDYVNYSDYDNYDKVIVDFSGIEQSRLKRAFGGRGSVYSTMDIVLTSFPRRSMCVGLLQDKKVVPTTSLAKQMLIENGIDIYADNEGTYRVTTNEQEDVMNLISMELPSDLRARKGHIKKFIGVFFQYYDEGQRVISEEGFSEYFPKSYNSVRYVKKFFLDGDIIHVQSPRPEKVRGVYMDDGRIMKLFYVSSYSVRGMTYGRYRATELLFAPKND